MLCGLPDQPSPPSLCLQDGGRRAHWAPSPLNPRALRAPLLQATGGIIDAQAEEVLGTSVTQSIPTVQRLTPTSVRLETLAAQALERDLLSEGQIAELLKIDRFKARRLRMEGEDSQDGVNQLPF